VRGRSLLFVISFLAALTIGVSSTASASSAGAKTRFISKLYGYSLLLPGGSKQWQVVYAQVRWTTGGIDPNLPPFDTFTDIQNQRAYLIGARRPPSGPTLDKWTAFVISSRPPACLAPRVPLANSTLSGAPARVLVLSCTDGYIVIGITALHAHHGYFMFVASPTSLTRASDRHAFDAARRTFQFLGK
jgi:hypothetical protein